MEPIIEGDVIRGDGRTILGADDKSGVASIVEAMIELEEQKIPHGDIQLLLTICEEIGLLGAALMDSSRIKAKYGFVFDSGPPVGAFVYHAPTQDTFEVWIHGTAGHAAQPGTWGLSNSNRRRSHFENEARGEFDPDTTANVGIIQGGSAANIIAPRLFEMRGPLARTGQA